MKQEGGQRQYFKSFGYTSWQSHWYVWSAPHSPLTLCQESLFKLFAQHMWMSVGNPDMLLNKSLNTNKLELLLTLKDQRTTWHNPKDRFAMDSALQTKQDMHEINTSLSWSKSLVKSGHHPNPKGFCSNSIRTSTERKITQLAFCWHRLCLTQPAVLPWAKRNP